MDLYSDPPALHIILILALCSVAKLATLLYVGFTIILMVCHELHQWNSF